MPTRNTLANTARGRELATPGCVKRRWPYYKPLPPVLLVIQTDGDDTAWRPGCHPRRCHLAQQAERQVLDQS